MRKKDEGNRRRGRKEGKEKGSKRLINPGFLPALTVTLPKHHEQMVSGAVTLPKTLYPEEDGCIIQGLIEK